MNAKLYAIACIALSLGCSKDATNPRTSPVDQLTPPLAGEVVLPEAPAADTGGELGGAPAPGSTDAATAGVCGTRGGVQCTADEFCNYGGDAQCGATDKGGTCKQTPHACTRIYLPVCGCDSRTYGNECEAHSHGASVKHAAMCTPEECTSAGGTVKYSNGADIPKCGDEQEQWSLSGGKEAVVCCRDKT